MRAVQLIIDQILGIEHLEIKLGKWNVISGGNAKGKTSILESLKAALGGGNCAELIRNGAKKGQSVLVFDNNYKLTANIGYKTTTRAIKTPEKATINAVGEWVEQHLKQTSFNPVDFIEADKKKRLEMLLAVAPLSMTFDEYEAAVGMKWVPFVVPTSKAAFALEDPLDKLDDAAKKITEHRKGLNASVDTLQKHAAELEKAIPADVEDADVKPLKAELDKLTGDKNVKIGEANRAYDSSVMSIGDLAKRSEAEHRKQMESEIQAARDRFDERMKVNQGEKDKRLLAAGKVKDEAIAKANSDGVARVEELVKEIGAAEEKAKLAAQAATTRANVEKARKDAEAKSEESINCTGQLKTIAEARTKLLEKLPVDGMSIRAGNVEYNGILFDTINTAEQIDIAMRLAEQSAGPLGLIIMDGLERLDDAKFAAVEARAKTSNCQFVVTKVTSGELHIETDGAAVAASSPGEAPPAPSSDEDAF